MNTERFYELLPPLTDFRGIMEGENFAPAPDDWAVVMTDVKGSTDAIRAGRYRDVNMLGASGITAVLNVTKDIDIPYVFGGDGATLLLPLGRLERALKELKKTQRMSKDLFGMELRIGAVPIKHLREKGADVAVAKYELSPGNTLAQFRGGGITRAEQLLKSGEGDAISPPALDEEKPDLSGLSCRWEPFRSRKGTILALLVMQRERGEDTRVLYSSVLQRLQEILDNDLKSANPVRADDLKGRFPSKSLIREAKIHSHGRVSLRKLLKYAAVHLVSFTLVNFNIVLGAFDPRRYRAETALNADFKKFDDMLRMVVDCSHEQADLIESLLARLHLEGKIYYGTHRSDQAVMTCLVMSASENKHVHFVDGSAGGYAMAAQAMKSQFPKTAG